MNQASDDAAEFVDPVPSDAAMQCTAALTRVTAKLPTGEIRPEQVQMCQAVADALAMGRHLVVQAGTGTGKSLAYSVPAASSGKSVVIVTATKALQDQLATKDLPLVAQSGSAPFTFAVLKGRANYICRQRVAEISGEGIQQVLVGDRAELMDGTEPTGVDGVDGVDGGPTSSTEGNPTSHPPAPGAEDRIVAQVERLLRWSEQSSTGDRADLPFEPHERAWSMVSVGRRECPGAFHCPSGNKCFAERARTTAAQADVVVVNTHLYGAHLASGGAVLPDHDVVIFDEAHDLEEIMTASLGVELSPGRFRSLARSSRSLVDEGSARSVDEVGELADRWQEALRPHLGRRVFQSRFSPGDGSEPGNARPTDPVTRAKTRELPSPTLLPDTSAETTLAGLIELSMNRVHRLVDRIEASRTSAPTDSPGIQRRAEGPPAGSSDAGRAARILAAAGNLASDLSRFAARTVEEVAWVDGVRHSPVLRLSPVDVGPILGERLWGDVTAVLTSATIPIGLAQRVGITVHDVDVIDVGSPFDYRTHALLYVARHLPDRRSPSSEAALHDELARLIRAAGGRTLALFTSRRATYAAAEALKKQLPYHILVQNDLPKTALLTQFTEDETSCLFATLGFWQGVDVPGRSLSLVTLDRLPFARPDDPLVEARRERAGQGAFRVVDLPRAAMLLAQGAGRLIRSAHDKGVVAVLDPRLATASYRGVLLATLPPMRRTTDFQQVERFLHAALNPVD